MAGLLAWAADVVAGNGVAGQQQQDEEEEERSRLRHTIRFSPDQQEEVRQLESRAEALQHTIQHLRLRIPPADISRSLPQLHSDSLAAHSALTSELNAHQATQKEAQTREAALRSENAAYTKAITSVQQQVQEKSQEKISLYERLQEMEKDELQLRVELDSLQSSLAAEKEARPSVLEDVGKADTPLLLSSDKALKEGEELQRTRAELKMWEVKLESLEQEWALLLQNSTRWPSSAQREKELERRLRSLSEQLVTKQVQADALTKERNSLEFQLRQANEIRRHTVFNNADGNAHRTKTRKIVPVLSSSASDALTEESKLYCQFEALEPDQAMVAAARKAFRHMAETLWSIWGLGKKWNRQISTQMRFSALRVLIIVYVLSLHIIAFAVIAFAT